MALVNNNRTKRCCIANSRINPTEEDKSGRVSDYRDVSQCKGNHHRGADHNRTVRGSSEGCENASICGRRGLATSMSERIHSVRDD